MKEDLTPRQQKLFEMLLNEIPPKEIAHNLHIKYNALLYHQKQLYRKLDVHSVNELIQKYAPYANGGAAGINTPESGELMPRKKTLPVKWLVIFGILLFSVVLLVILFFIRKPANEGHPAVFNRWNTFTDKAGSSVDVTMTRDDSIDGKPFTSYTMSGVLSGAEGWHYAGMILRPAPLTLQAMSRMSSFSFKVLGDGKPYKINIPTTDTQLDIEDKDKDHYSAMFPTIDGQISTITITVDELMQEGYGKQVPFIRDNIISLDFYANTEFLTESSEAFNLKIWDIRIF